MVSLTYLLHACDTLIAQRRLDEAYKLSSSIVNTFPHSTRAHMLHSRVCILYGRTEDGKERALKTQVFASDTLKVPTWSQPLSKYRRATIVDSVAKGSRVQYAHLLASSMQDLVGSKPALLTSVSADDPPRDLFSSCAKVIKVPQDAWFTHLDNEGSKTVIAALGALEEPHLIAFPGFQEYVVTLLPLLAFARWRAQHSIIFTVYDANHLRPESTRAHLIRITTSLPVTILLTGANTLELAKELLPVRIVSIPDSPPTAITQHGDDSYLRSSNKTTFLAVGRQSDRKGLLDLIKAARIISNELPRTIHLRLIGCLEQDFQHLLPQLRAISSTITHENNFVSDTHLARAYQACDYVLLPYSRSFWSTSGVFACAMHFGKPVISTSHGWLGDTVHKYGVGSTYSSGDSEVLASLIKAFSRQSHDDRDALVARCATYASLNCPLVARSAINLGIRLALHKSALPIAADQAIIPVDSRDKASITLAKATQPVFGHSLPLPKGVPNIGILNTSIATSNLGDLIICEAVHQVLRTLFPTGAFFELPTHEYLSFEASKLIDKCDFLFLAGTNLLGSSLDTTKQWKIGPYELSALHNVVLLGCGWHQYQEAPNLYSATALRSLLEPRLPHSVRDTYTVEKLRGLGLRAINTACPTMWALTSDHISQVPQDKGRSVVFTLTDYNRSPADDAAILQFLGKQYNTVYVWLQSHQDYQYLLELAGRGISMPRVIEPSLFAYDALLAGCDSLDYIGTRLHAGIRALQFKRRTLILAVDNRATEIAKDTGLPVIARSNAIAQLASLVHETHELRLTLPLANIEQWKAAYS